MCQSNTVYAGLLMFTAVDYFDVEVLNILRQYVWVT